MPVVASHNATGKVARSIGSFSLSPVGTPKDAAADILTRGKAVESPLMMSHTKQT